VLRVAKARAVHGDGIAQADAHRSNPIFEFQVDPLSREESEIMKATRTLLFFATAAVASATSVTFTFDTQVINGTTITGLSENASIASIQTYMNQVLAAAGCTGCSVSVTGAAADTTYNGEGNVVGNGAKSLTLGTSNNATSNSSQNPTSTFDTFLANTNDASQQQASQITMKFSGFTVSGAASFAYEIFPDGSCPVLNSSSCGGSPTGGIYPNQPDMKFDVNGSSPVTSFGNNGVQYGVTPSSSGADGSSVLSPNNTSTSNSELSPQWIGTWAGNLSNANELDFIDWPATIGVDNLMISWTTTTQQSPVPEPFSVVLLGTIVGGIALRKKIRKTVA
jgi:hypothetical protein